MSKNNVSLGKLLAKLSEATLKANSHKYFETKNHLVREKVWMLTKGPLKNQFQDSLRELRDQLKIPKLNPQSDINLIPSPYPEISDSEIEESSWLYSQKNDYITLFENRVTNILSQFQLANNFRDWIEYWILYRNQPKSHPINYFDLILDSLTDSQKLELASLTTSEKKFAQRFIPEALGFKKKPPIELSALYTKVREAVSKSKNTKRRSNSFGIAKKATLVGTSKYKSYGEVVVDTFSFEEEQKQGPDKIKARLRKQKERLLKKHSPK